MKRLLLSAIAATAVGCGPMQPIPVNARPTDSQAAAWSMANVFCTARASGVQYDMAMQTAFVSSQELWGRVVFSPVFARLAAFAIVSRCGALARPPVSI